MPSTFNNPDLMVIGDSLPQGCRSMTVSRDFCARSYPAQVADLNGLEFNSPQHPRPVLLDLESIAGDLLFQGLPAIFGGIGQNYADWLADFAAPLRRGAGAAGWFDNLSVAGFTLEDVFGDPAQSDGRNPGLGTADLADRVLARTPSLDVTKQFNLVFDLHIATNARYVLNPTNDPRYRAWSQVDWVEARKPKTLIVHVGHNNGLYSVGGRGDFSAWAPNWTGTPAPTLARYKVLIDRLRRSLPDTRIIFAGLPKIGAVSNLMPLGSEHLRADPDYFASYETQFPFRIPVDGAAIRTVDRQILSVNQSIASFVQAADEGRGLLSFFDTFQFFQKHDTKNLGESPLQVGRYTIDNNYLAGEFRRQAGRPGVGGRCQWEFTGGGFQSIDGMHPTSIGYALLAFEIAGLLAGAPVSPKVRERQLKQIIRGERLIWQYPQGLDALTRTMPTTKSTPALTSLPAKANRWVSPKNFR